MASRRQLLLRIDKSYPQCNVLVFTFCMNLDTAVTIPKNIICTIFVRQEPFAGIAYQTWYAFRRAVRLVSL